MRTRRLVLLLCLLCLAGAWVLWRQPANTRTKPSALPQAAAPAANPAVTAPNILAASSTNGAASAKTNKFAFRLSNTAKSLGQLAHDRHAILLENALIDTANPLNLSIPTHLQSQGDPGAYIVQARGPIDAAFRAMLAAAGAEIVSYIPNNAYLVRAPAGVANGLAGNPLTQAVTPYEPYYKIQSSLMQWVGQPLPDGGGLTLGLFSDKAQETIKQIENSGWEILTEEKTPVGTIVKVVPPPHDANWMTVATLPGTKNVELSRQRVPANDLSRVTVGVAADTRTATNYLGLSGLNVIVEVNDSGIDATHPDLTGRVLGSPTTDTNGHGTHVAGIIAGNGSKSSTVRNAPGSVTNANFRGMATNATLLAMDWYNSDQDLQAAAALTNALISNNSWNYGNAAYDLSAASYDAAVRDALPGTTGSQPVLFVFSAGNNGNGDNSGGGGDPDTILSPATAKNVITVGALEQLRNITNKVVDLNKNTNAVWQPQTDTSFQVAGYSSHGNVGIGTEGTYGRYKPDVVAPGTFVISTRSQQWGTNAYYNPTNDHITALTDLVQPNSLTVPPLQFFVYKNAVQVTFAVEANSASPSPMPDLPIYVWPGTDPNTTAPVLEGTNFVTLPPSPANKGWQCAVSNTTAGAVIYDLVVDVRTTNDLGNYYQVLEGMNDSLGGFYRYETGTSMSAADVSGVLALMQDYFKNRTSLTNPSPVLLKAMLINGARVTGTYNFQAQNSINYEGWGLINLPDSLPPGVTNQLNRPCASYIADQSTNNALATGDTHTYGVTLTSAAAAQPLRITLAWTDPPGDPVAAIKLVNDLNLVVSNRDSGLVYYGNDIPASSTFNSAQNSTNTPNYDFINNVENVYLPLNAGMNFTVTVLGYRVNVNAVTAHTNNVVQDYALVISSGNGQIPNAFTVTDNPIVSNPTTGQQITFVISTNNAPLLNQFVGASTPLLGTNNIQLTNNSTELNGIQIGGTNLMSGSNILITLGMTNQWHFYVVTNPPSNAADFTNAAFITFIPDTLSIPRIGVYQDSQANATRPEADIDLYVSTNPKLMILDPAVISNADKSVGRGGVEFVYYTNSAPGKVYYVGVYSEDREASEYGFISIFTDIPFSQMNPNGSQTVNGLNVPVNIPDGSPAHPGAGYVFALAINPMEAKRIVVTDTITHQNFGDLIGTLTHSQQTGLGGRDVLNDHDPFYNASGIYTNIYDDSNQGNIAGSQPSDGPGSLNSFVGQQAIGPWILNEVDTSLTQIGSVTAFSLLIEPHQDMRNGITGTVPATGWFYDYIDVPAGATNLTISATNTTTPLSQTIYLYVNTNTEPTLTNFIATVALTNAVTLGPGGSISIGPPLTPGRYWVGLWNPSPDPQDFFLIATLGMGAAPEPVVFSSSGPAPILDDAVITNSIFVTADRILSSVDVALRVDHPRVSDLVFHLVSPDGSRVLLVENRGGDTTNGMGKSYAITNIIPVSSHGGAAPVTNLVTTASSSGTLTVYYDFQPQADEMVVFDQGGNLIFDSGFISYSGVFNIAYTNSSVLTIVMNPNGNPQPTTIWDYTVKSSVAYNTYLVLTEDTNKTTIPIKYAMPPFHGAPTLTTVTNHPVVATILVPVTNAAAGWHSSFEGNPFAYGWRIGSFIAEGWEVVGGDIDTYNSADFPSPAFEGTNFVDIDGYVPGTIATNVATVPGQTYQLSFAYAQNPDGTAYGNPTASVQLLADGNPLLTLTLAMTNNTWANPGWATTSLLFTATSPSTRLTFQSLDPSSTDNQGVLLDAIDLAPVSGANGFERAAAGDYAQDHYFDGWFVNANQVTVITDTNLAVEGTNLLALAGGQISRLLPTVPGQTYTLSYAYRGPGAAALWRGENNATDSIASYNGTVTAGTIAYAAAEVGEGFSFDGGANRILVNDAPALNFGPSKNFSVDAWIEPQSAMTTGNVMSLVDKRTYVGANDVGYEINLDHAMIHCRLSAGTGNGYGPYGPVLTDGNFHHVALSLVRNSTTGGNLYVDGQLVGTFDPTGDAGDLTNPGPLRIGNHVDPGYNSFFKGMVDEVTLYSRDLSASEIQAIYQNGISGKYDINAPSIAQGLAEAYMTVGGNPFPVFYGDNANWRTNTLTFTASQSNTVLQVTGLEPGMLLDNFTLTQLVYVTTNVLATNASGGDVYYLPEDSLDTLAGKNTLGQWQLEVWDNRAGAYASNLCQLVSWQLRFNFASFYSSVSVLTNGLAMTNVIPPGGLAYYLVVVPPNADMATNRLFATNGTSLSGPLNLWFNQTTQPVGTNPPDFLLLPNSTGGSSLLTLTSTPANIVPGGTYYLAVQNPGTTSITYGIEVDFHLLFPPVPAGSVVFYPITVPINADIATNILISPNGPLNLWFDQVTPPTGAGAGDYLLLGGTTNGTAILYTNGTPPLVPGSTYYLGVQNTNSFAVTNYSITVDFHLVPVPIVLTNGQPQTNTVPAGGIDYYLVNVPTNADWATNLLIFAGGPLNVWFNPTNLPVGANPPDSLLFGGATNGIVIFGTNTIPTNIVPGGTYYLAVQNPGTSNVTYGIEVNFHLQSPSVPAGSVVFYPITVPTNADFATNILVFATGPLNIWFTTNSPPSITNANDVRLLPDATYPSGTNGSVVLSAGTTPPLVPGSTYYLGLQNTNSFAVAYAIEVDFHLQLPPVPAGSVIYYPVAVPTNADFATNILLYATGPLNIWFTTNSPSSITNTNDVRLLPDATYPSGTNGSVVLSAGTTPPLVPGTTYYLGVQNTNPVAVSYEIEVNFHLLSVTNIGTITDLTITATNIGGTNGFLLQWQGPTNFQYEMQWTTSLAPAVWHTVLNPVINAVVTTTNGHFSWFDDGSLTGGFGPTKFYRVLGGLNLGPITGPGPVTNTVLAGATSQAVVTVPANALWASNVLLSATGPLNVWFNQTNPPTGNTGAGDVLMLSATSAGVFVLTSNSVPPLVPGTNYYLGFQNPGTSNVTFGFEVTFGFAPAIAPSISSITLTTNGLFQLQWTAPTNYQFQVEWTTNLMPPIVWNYIPPSPPWITSTNVTFTFVDTNPAVQMKFYRLIQQYP